MSELATHRQFFGETEHAFALTPDLIIELERVTGTGIGALARKVFAGEFRHREVTEAIRLALIGGGTKPEDAAALTDLYAAKRPIGEAYPLAVAILETAWFGAAETQKTNVRASTTEKEADRAA